MVSSFLTRLNEKYNDQLDEKAQKYIYYATDGAKRMRNIILDILEYSRVGKQAGKSQEVDLNDMVTETLRVLNKSIEESNAKVECDELPVVHSYKLPIQQILQNLIGNAIKYSKPDVAPEVSIKVKERSNDWVISVEDNGIGIEKEYFDKIFLIFQRLHGREQYEGSGMGLAIVKKNIDKLGEKIWLESEVDKGSTIYFTIKKQNASD
jgi:light-regulated signal transduction histidine kinase (bacteriophytochrome)